MKYYDALTGEGSPVEAFRNDSTISACFAVTPDMFGLCTSLTDVGTGAEGTVKGAHVLVSTAELSRSTQTCTLPEDFYDANRPLVRKFVAGYLKRQRNWSTSDRHTRQEHGMRLTSGC